MRKPKYTGDIYADTPLIPELLAETITQDRGEAEALAKRAYRQYRECPATGGFVRRMLSARCRDYISMFMAHWLDAMRSDPARYRERNAPDFAKSQ